MRIAKQPPAKQPSMLKQPSPTIMDAPQSGLANPSLSKSSKDGDIHNKIAEAAYCRAAQRGFESGHEIDDWLSAEAEIMSSSLHRMPIAPKGEDR